jgi:hypothetical protein
MGELQWRPPTVNRIAWILHHPIYTGAYVYGLHRQGVKNPVTGRTVTVQSHSDIDLVCFESGQIRIR